MADHDLRKRFGLLVAAHRKRKRLTQEGLAIKAGLSPDMISRIEAGHTGARFPSIERLAAALDIDPAELFTTELPAGLPARSNALTSLVARLSALRDQDLTWLEGIIDAALKPRR